ncbi:hypothetical protein HK096_001127, partial [Nowakowskiella sp. JEL0078]
MNLCRRPAVGSECQKQQSMPRQPVKSEKAWQSCQENFDTKMFSTTQPQQKDIEVVSPPNDGISDLSFSPVADYLAASSWDNFVGFFNFPNHSLIFRRLVFGRSSPQEQLSQKLKSNMAGRLSAVLGPRFKSDGTKVFAGGADKTGRVLDISTGQTATFASHDAPIKCARWVDGVNNMQNIIATGINFETRLFKKYWDLRSPNPAFVLNLPERCYTMDVVFPLMVVGTAEKHILVYHLQNPTVVFKNVASPLKHQTRVLSCFPSASGFAVGSIEGRVGIQNVEDKDSHLNFSFKCHRDDKNVYAVNAISFHPGYSTFSTAGADGTFNFWDKDSKQRLKSFNNIGQPISATAFSRNGQIFAYAGSYDWSK